MTALPIVDRELRVASRRRFAYWMRSLSALTVLGIGMAVWLGQPTLHLGRATLPRMAASHEPDTPEG